MNSMSRRKDSQSTDADDYDHDHDLEYKNGCGFMPSCTELGIPMHCADVEAAYCAGYTGSGLYDVYRNHFGHDLLPPSSSLDFPSDDLPLCLEALCHEDRRFVRRRLIHSPGLQLDGIRYGNSKDRVDPYSPVCMVPLPDHFGEPCFIRRRNERERERVRCVNEGYSRLKEHLPCEGKERRMSKVETLRGAIDYIRQLQGLLETDNKNNKNSSKNNNSLRSTNDTDHPDWKEDNSLIKHKRRTCSISSSEPDSPDSYT